MKPVNSSWVVPVSLAITFAAFAPASFGQTGACCLGPVGQIDCFELSAGDCALAGGTYGGDGTTCPGNTTATFFLSGPATQVFLHPAVSCLDVGTTGQSCQEGTGPFVDAWVTAPPGFGEDTCHSFGTVPESPPIPPGFFGPGSDPFFGTVCFAGVPLGPTPFGQFDVADTLILRSDDPFDRCDIPSPGPAAVDIQIVELNLQSLQPIVVTFNGGQNPMLWDVQVDLSTNGPLFGALSVIKTHCNGGTYDSFLPVLPRFTFINPNNPGDVRILDTGNELIPPVDLNAFGTPWVQQVDLGVSKSDSRCTDFHPGVDDPSPPLTCPLPAQERVALKLSSTATKLTLEPGVDCNVGGTNGFSCTAGPQIDPWRVATPGPGNETCHTFGTGPESPPIPPDFFDPGSEPFFGEVCYSGVPLGPTPFGTFGDADTLILRSGDPFDRCDIPSPTDQFVDIEIVSLNLQSLQPITVTTGGSETLWDVFVDLSTTGAPLGAMTATKTHCNGGTYDSVLRIQPRFTFVQVGNPSQVRVLDTGAAGIPPTQFINTNAPWVNDADPLFLPLSQNCTDFRPGLNDFVPQFSCDCQSNGIRDTCDLESGTSFDCNTNLTPDECDGGVPGDYTGDGIVDLVDYSSFEGCLAGPGAAPNGLFECHDLCRAAFDSDNDLDIDLFDFRRIAETLGQP